MKHQISISKRPLEYTLGWFMTQTNVHAIDDLLLGVNVALATGTRKLAANGTATILSRMLKNGPSTRLWKLGRS